MQLRALGSDRGGSTFVDFFELLTVGVVAYRFEKSGQEVVADFQAIALAFEAAIDEPQQLLRSDLGVSTVLETPRAYLNAELESCLIILKIQERTEIGREHVCAYQHFEGKIVHDAELVPDEIGAEGDGQYRKALEVEGLAIASNHPHVSRVSNWRFEGESIENRFIDEIKDRTGICLYQDGQNLKGSEYEEQLHLWSPWGGLWAHRGHGGVDDSHGGLALERWF